MSDMFLFLPIDSSYSSKDVLDFDDAYDYSGYSTQELENNLQKKETLTNIVFYSTCLPLLISVFFVIPLLISFMLLDVFPYDELMSIQNIVLAFIIGFVPIAIVGRIATAIQDSKCKAMRRELKSRS